MKASSKKLRLPEIDAFKGILILLIVLGHNTLFSAYSPAAFSVLYNFHVASFLLLPFLFSGESSREYRLRDRSVRYLVPQFTFFAAACVVYYAFSGAIGEGGTPAWLGSVGLAVLVSSEGAYAAACGFRMFWFLPMLLVLTLLRAFYLQSGRRRRYGILVVTFGVHLFLGLVPENWLPWFPWGTPLALFVFPLALLSGEVWKRMGAKRWFFLLSGAVFVGCMMVGYRFGSYSALAGDPVVFSIQQPLRLLFHDLYLASAFFGLLGLAHLVPVRPLAAIGRESLVIFLAHGFFWQAFVRLGLADWMASSGFGRWIPIALGFVLTLGASYLLAAIVGNRTALRSALTPRDWADWSLAPRPESVDG